MTPLRARLMNPPNAVPDTGINLRNGRPVLKVAPLPKPEPSRWKMPTLTLVWEVTPYEPPDTYRVVATPPGYSKPKATAILIINEICAAWGIPQYRLVGDERFSEIVRPRWAAMAIIRRITPLSYPQIAKFVGKRDHSSVMSGCRKMDDHIAALDQELSDWSSPAEWVRALKARIEA